MKPSSRILAFQFEYRIFISLAIVLAACTAAYVPFGDGRTTMEWMFGPSGRSTGFLVAALLCAVATMLRMSAGTVLHSQRVMSFGVRPERLSVEPPYTFVRNPIYLSDLIAAAGFSLCMPPAGLLFPSLLSAHYIRLIRWEEASLSAAHGPAFQAFLTSTPRLIPRVRSLKALISGIRGVRIDRDGARYNALYVLFVPGLLIASVTGEFFHAVLIGLPGVADWAYWHTIKGMSRPPSLEVPS
jgi:protein-S-isoprenylcysteine O-methyltransferase Ste14